MLFFRTALLVELLIYAVTAGPQNDEKPLHYLQHGNNAYGAGDLPTALKSYEKCLEINSTFQWCLVNLASVLVDLGGDANLVRAEELYRQVLAKNPSDGDASFNLALLLQDKKTEASTREAASLYDTSVKADPSRWDAWANMASALSELKEEPLKAIYSFERSILIIEETAENDNDEENNRARDLYLSKLYYGYGILLSELTPEACSILAAAPQSLLIGKDTQNDGQDAPTAELCLENAQNIMRTATSLDPDNAQAAHMLAAIITESDPDGNNALRRATPEFVAALFDDFADTFDAKLGALQYKVPRLIGAAAVQAQRLRGKNFRSALDAGCGTGLAGPYLRPLVDASLIGVDISQKMLDKAAKCTTLSGCGREEDSNGGDASPLYEGLLPLDLETMTLMQTLGTISPDTDEAGFDLIVAADVLVYFGNLENLIGNFAKLASIGSSLIFSCERTAAVPGGWKLLSSGRFAHTKAYVLEIANRVGYELINYQEIVPRMEKGEEVQGHLFTFILRDSFDSGRKVLENKEL